MGKDKNDACLSNLNMRNLFVLVLVHLLTLKLVGRDLVDLL